MGLGCDRQVRPASVLLIDENERVLKALGDGLTDHGVFVWTARTFDDATRVLDTNTPSYVVSEMKIDGLSLLDYMNDVAAAVSVDRFVVATAYPSVATAVHFARMGVAAYLAKPVSPQGLLTAVTMEAVDRSLTATQEPLTWPTLDRTIWEYLSQTCVSAGSISEAARRLGLDRRSLRRMLSKYPPPR